MSTEDFSEYRSAVLARTRRLMGNDAEAEDMAQEALLRAHQNRDKLIDPQASLAWLLRIADRVCIDQLRRRDPLRSPEPADHSLDVAGDTPSGPFTMAQREMSDCTMKYLDLLSASHRQILHLVDVEGRDLKETAGCLGISKGAAKIRLHRARADLRRQLVKACTFSTDERGVLVCEPSNGR